MARYAGVATARREELSLFTSRARQESGARARSVLGWHIFMARTPQPNGKRHSSRQQKLGRDDPSSMRAGGEAGGEDGRAEEGAERGLHMSASEGVLRSPQRTPEKTHDGRLDGRRDRRAGDRCGHF